MKDVPDIMPYKSEGIFNHS